MNLSQKSLQDFEREYFVKQLLFIEENYYDLNNYYLYSTPLKERVKDFLSLYIGELENYLARESLAEPLSQVFIGTKVTVLFKGENEAEDYHICLPEQSDPDSGRISFLSPVGRQLLLKKLGDEIALDVPNGTIILSIEDISFSGVYADLK